jgi:hypothetical protein
MLADHLLIGFFHLRTYLLRGADDDGTPESVGVVTLLTT